MDRRLIVILAVAAHLYSVALADGPVYGGQGNAVPPAPAGNFITQTVYGFLDFTTTIGNTVMVFSPQSAPPPEQPKTEKSVQENIIETKPPASVTNVKPEAIKPSKISDKDKTNKPIAPAVVSSAISVVSSSPKKDNKVANAPKSVAKEQKQIITKVEVVAGPSKIVESNSSKQSSPKSNKQNSPANNAKNKKNEVKSITSVVSSKVEVKQGSPASITSSKVNSVVQVKSSQTQEEPAILIANNNIGEPEYDFLSRQPSEFVEETYKVINIRPSKAHGQKPKLAHKNRAHQPTPPPDDDDDHPLGLVTTLGGTIVKDGLTTVHETSVIGTYISGKYAQVLNSNSKILPLSGHRGKISPSPPHRILKTVAPSIVKNHRHNLEPTPSISDDDSNFGKTTRRQSNSGGSFKNRHRSQNNPEPEVNHDTPSPSQAKKFKNRNNAQRTQSTRFGRPVNAPQLATVSVFSETATSSYSNRRKSNRNSGHKTTVTPASNNDNQPRRGFKPRVQASPVEQITSGPSTSVYKFKLNRSPGSGRWQYKTSPKPKVTIRKIMGDDEPQTTPNPNPLLDDPQSNDISLQARSDNDLELSGSQSGPGTLLENDTEDNSLEKPPPVETLKVEISTPADFKDVYYEIATIKSPYTFQVGRVKNTRIITVTSTIERRIEPTVLNSQNSLNEPLTENILSEKDHQGLNLLDSSISTLPAITLSSDMETPPLETITETFSTTQTLLKTHILPVVRNVNLTSSLTFIQTYLITRLVTATKTLPPMDFFQFIPSKTLKEFNSRLDEAGSELHLELDFGDSNEDEDGVPRRVFPPDLDLANIGSDFDLTEVDKYRLAENHLRLKKAHGQSKGNHVTEAPNTPTPALTPEQAQQLALLRLLNPAAAAQIPDIITTSKPVLKYETIYETHVLPVFDGKNTIQSTISRAVATITRTEYELGTSSLPALQGLQPLNPLFPQQFTLTSTPVVVNTEVVETSSQVLKLTFGAKTVYTTLFKTQLVPKMITSYVTSSVPVAVQPSAPGYPGYFPAPYAPFPYVG